MPRSGCNLQLIRYLNGGSEPAALGELKMAALIHEGCVNCLKEASLKVFNLGNIVMIKSTYGWLNSQLGWYGLKSRLVLYLRWNENISTRKT